ncbi:MAG: DUF2141 domain-containing protein [Flavobacteriaceae bacterium]|nr:DUF2141 domain-containing protein [Flavobacteriaceae bacterium]
MKIISFIIPFFVFSYMANSQNLTVTVDNVLNTNGQVLIALHTSETFMKGPGIQNEAVGISGNSVTVTFKDVEPGSYAIMVLHDENSNHRMDYEVTGMPKENYGTSNNAMSFGPPRFEDARFDMTEEDLELKIRF